MSNISTARKLKEKRGTGTGADYKPWILAREIGSIGTEAVFNDWKHGRPIQCLSQGEKRVYTLLRWRDDVIDIQEQYPLELSLTLAIARKLKLPHPHDTTTYMTTDFLVTFQTQNGSRFQKAYNVKPNEKAINDYCLKNFAIEQDYWAIKGIRLEIIYSDQINKILASNIQQCVKYYKPSSIQTKTDFVKHLIAHKILSIDMESTYLDFPTLVDKYLGSPEQAQKYLAIMQQTHKKDK